MRMSELLNEVRRFSLDEGFSPREIKMAIGIASDPRYAKGNMTGAVTAIERMKKGLSDHPQVAAVLKRQNEDLDEASKEGTIKIIKTKDGKFQIQKMTKGKFVDIGKPHNSAKEAEKFRSGQPDLFGEAVSMAQQAAIAISKKEKGEKPKDERDEGNEFGMALKSARDKGEKTFVVSGKKYNVTEDYDIDEAKKKPVSQMTPKEKEADAARRKEYKAYQKSKRNEEGEASRIVEPYRPEFGLDEAPKMTYALVGTDMKIYAIGDEKEMNLNRRSLEKRLKDVSPLKIARLKTAQSIGDKVDKSQLKEEVEIDEISNFSRAHIAILKKTFDPMRDKRLGPKGQAKLSKIMDMIGDKKDALIDLFKADIPFVSQSAAAMLITKYNMKGDEINKLKEEVELDEKYDLYHKDFSSAMQHAYDYAKSKMGITVDPKEIDNKVATGPKKPSEGKTNTYKLKGKGGNLQIQVYNKGGSKPFELNMYKEENALIPESNDLISQTVNLITYTQMQEKQDSADVDDDASQKDVDDAAKNIIMQLRKSVSMRGDKEVEFAAIGHGYKKKVDMKIAQKALDMYNKMKPQDKTKFQTTIAKSYKDLLNAIKGK